MVKLPQRHRLGGALLRVHPAAAAAAAGRPGSLRDSFGVLLGRYLPGALYEFLVTALPGQVMPILILKKESRRGPNKESRSGRVCVAGGGGG